MFSLCKTDSQVCHHILIIEGSFAAPREHIEQFLSVCLHQYFLYAGLSSRFSSRVFILEDDVTAIRLCKEQLLSACLQWYFFNVQLINLIVTGVLRMGDEQSLKSTSPPFFVYATL